MGEEVIKPLVDIMAIGMMAGITMKMLDSTSNNSNRSSHKSSSRSRKHNLYSI